MTKRFCGMWILVVALTSGCMSGRSPDAADILPNGDKASIRMVDFKRTPEMEPHAKRARELGNEVYPKIVALLSDDSTQVPERVDVRFKKRFSIFLRLDKHGDRRIGYVRARDQTVNIDATSLFQFLQNPGSNLLTNDPSLFDSILIHELVHVAQFYPSSTFRNQAHWAEGIADYVRYKLGDTNKWRCAECSTEFFHYTSGYTCAGAFLLYVDELYGAHVVRQMNSELRRGTYSDDFFIRSTGKSLSELWGEFQKRPEFTPIAAEMNKLQNALGYVNGKPPRRLEVKFKRYLEEHPQGDEIKPWLASLITSKNAGKKVTLRMLMFIYFSQPGGTAEMVLARLIDQKELPGNFKEDDSFTLNFFLHFSELNSVFDSNTRTLVCGKSNDPTSKYNYTFVRASRGAEWKLQKAWRTSADGAVLEEFPITGAGE